MVLTEKQRQDLHQSILAYMTSMGDQFHASVVAFAKEAGLNPDKHPANNATGTLEKKWTSVIRLQRKVMELEQEVQYLSEQSKLNGVISRRDVLGANQRELLPHSPATFSLQAHRGPITDVAFHPVFSIFASASEDATIKIWDFETGEFERSLKGHTNTVHGLAFNRSGTLLASASSDMSIKIWDFHSDTRYECLRTLRGHDHHVSCVRFSPSDETDRLYSSSRDQTIKEWEVSTGFCVRTISTNDWIRDLSVSDDGKYLSGGGNDHQIDVYETRKWSVMQTLKGHEHVIESVCFASNKVAKQISKLHSKQLSGAHDAHFASEESPTIEEGRYQDDVRENQFVLTASRDRSVRLWEVVHGTLLMTFTSHENWVKSARFHASGKYVISIGDERTIRVFEIETGRCVRTLDEVHDHLPTALDVHPTLPLVLSGGLDHLVNVWECD